MPLKILQICFRMPWPLKDGGAIAMYYITSGLVEAGCNVTVIVPETLKHKADLNSLPRHVSSVINFYKLPIDIKITIWGAFINLFSKKPYYISRYIDKKFELLIKNIVEENSFDIIIFESLKMAPYVDVVRKLTTAKLVLRSHNIEHLIWGRMAETTENVFKKLYLKHLSNRLKNYELKIIHHFDAILPITKVDADYFVNHGYNKKHKVILAGIDFSRLVKSNKDIEEFSLFHLGALDWLSNQEAINWFLKNVWPEIFKKYPQLKFYLAGRNMPQQYMNLNIPGVITVGEVDDAISFINHKQIMIVPLLSGSGMRIKIAEGMALGKVIISTRTGAEGIEYSNYHNLLIADKPKDFCDAIDFLMKNNEAIAEIGSNAEKFAQENLNNTKIIKEMIDFLKEL